MLSLTDKPLMNIHNNHPNVGRLISRCMCTVSVAWVGQQTQNVLYLECKGCKSVLLHFCSYDAKEFLEKYHLETCVTMAVWCWCGGGGVRWLGAACKMSRKAAIIIFLTSGWAGLGWAGLVVVAAKT